MTVWGWLWPRIWRRIPSSPRKRKPGDKDVLTSFSSFFSSFHRGRAVEEKLIIASLVYFRFVVYLMLTTFIRPFDCDFSLHKVLFRYLPIQHLCRCVSGGGPVCYYLTSFSFILRDSCPRMSGMGRQVIFDPLPPPNILRFIVFFHAFIRFLFHELVRECIHPFFFPFFHWSFVHFLFCLFVWVDGRSVDFSWTHLVAFGWASHVCGCMFEIVCPCFFFCELLFWLSKWMKSFCFIIFFVTSLHTSHATVVCV